MVADKKFNGKNSFSSCFLVLKSVIELKLKFFNLEHVFGYMEIIALNMLHILALRDN